jgi:hypothetical protein
MDKSTKDFTINAELLGALGSLWQGKPTTVSPFRYGDGKAPGKEEKNLLTAGGVCDANGQPVPGIRPALDVLGNARSFTRMYISGGLNAYEYIVYFSDDNKSASLINVHGDVQINYPSIGDLFVTMATQAIGSTMYRNSTLEVNLTPDEALVFSALLDLQRQEFLHSLAGPEESRIVVSLPSDIGTILSRKGKDYQWLNNVIRDIAGPADIPIQGQITAALESITGKGLAAKDKSAYKLSDTALLLARRMLVLDTSVVLTSGHLGPDGIVSIAGFTCIQAGVHDLLYIDEHAGSVAVQTISSAAVLDLIREFMTDPLALKQLDKYVHPVPQSPADIKGGNTCPQCGAKLTAGKKFCSNCGAKVS